MVEDEDYAIGGGGPSHVDSDCAEPKACSPVVLIRRPPDGLDGDRTKIILPYLLIRRFICLLFAF